MEITNETADVDMTLLVADPALFYMRRSNVKKGSCPSLVHEMSMHPSCVSHMADYIHSIDACAPLACLTTGVIKHHAFIASLAHYRIEALHAMAVRSVTHMMVLCLC